MDRRRILAIGSGAWSFGVHRHITAIEAYGLSLTGKSSPRVCFLPTAAGDAPELIVAFYEAFAGGHAASHISLFGETTDDPRAHLLRQDVIYVGGGITAFMLAAWRLAGIDAALREAWEAGVVLMGTSAGAVAWFESSLSHTRPGWRSGDPWLLHDGLSFLPGSVCAHYAKYATRRRPAYRAAVAKGLPDGLPDGIAMDDGCALLYEGTQLKEVLAADADQRAYHVRGDPSQPYGVAETPLEARVLAD